MMNCFRILVLPGMFLPCLHSCCKFTTLSVTSLGLRLESFIAFLDTGNMPVFLKPDCTAATVKGLSPSREKWYPKFSLGHPYPNISEQILLEIDVPVHFKICEWGRVQWLENMGWVALYGKDFNLICYH